MIATGMKAEARPSSRSEEGSGTLVRVITPSSENWPDAVVRKFLRLSPSCCKEGNSGLRSRVIPWVVVWERLRKSEVKTIESPAGRLAVP